MTSPLPPESDGGNIEYKLVVKGDDNTVVSLQTQMNCRLLAGHGAATYWVGVFDCGARVGLGRGALDTSLRNLRRVAEGVGATVGRVSETTVSAGLPLERAVHAELRRYVPLDQNRFVANVEIRRAHSKLPPIYLGGDDMT